MNFRAATSWSTLWTLPQGRVRASVRFVLEPLFAKPFTWPEVANERVLVLGLGGGSDAICAYAIAQPLGAAYGNTKHALDADLVRVSSRIGRLPGDVEIRGTTKIERRLPRGPHGSPLVLACPRDEETVTLSAELRALAFDRVIGIDTGGDVLDGTVRGARGRDRRMLEVLRGLGVPALVAVIAPGSDGQQSREALGTALLATAGYRGVFSLEPYVPILREHGRELGAERTPNIICRAFDSETDPVEVPRGRRPHIPRAWLTSAFVFDV